MNRTKLLKKANNIRRNNISKYTFPDRMFHDRIINTKTADYLIKYYNHYKTKVPYVKLKKNLKVVHKDTSK